MSGDPEYDRWLAEQAEQEAAEEAFDELGDQLPGNIPKGRRVYPLLVTEAERNRIRASLNITAAIQAALGDNASALESTMLSAKVSGDDP
jgi:hypothetical protein